MPNFNFDFGLPTGLAYVHDWKNAERLELMKNQQDDARKKAQADKMKLLGEGLEPKNLETQWLKQGYENNAWKPSVIELGKIATLNPDWQYDINTMSRVNKIKEGVKNNDWTYAQVNFNKQLDALNKYKNEHASTPELESFYQQEFDKINKYGQTGRTDGSFVAKGIYDSQPYTFIPPEEASDFDVVSYINKLVKDNLVETPFDIKESSERGFMVFGSNEVLTGEGQQIVISDVYAYPKAYNAMVDILEREKKEINKENIDAKIIELSAKPQKIERSYIQKFMGYGDYGQRSDVSIAKYKENQLFRGQNVDVTGSVALDKSGKPISIEFTPEFYINTITGEVVAAPNSSKYTTSELFTRYVMIDELSPNMQTVLTEKDAEKYVKQGKNVFVIPIMRGSITYPINVKDKYGKVTGSKTYVTNAVEVPVLTNSSANAAHAARFDIDVYEREADEIKRKNDLIKQWKNTGIKTQSPKATGTTVKIDKYKNYKQ